MAEDQELGEERVGGEEEKGLKREARGYSSSKLVVETARHRLVMVFVMRGV